MPLLLVVVFLISKLLFSHCPVINLPFKIIIVHILNVYSFHFPNSYLPHRFCARSRSIFGDLKSLSMTWWQVFRGPPFLLLPLKLYILHFITTLSSLHLSTWPNHLNLPLLMLFQGCDKSVCTGFKIRIFAKGPGGP